MSPALFCMPCRHAGKCFNVGVWATQERKGPPYASEASDMEEQCRNNENMSKDVWTCTNALHKAGLTGGEGERLRTRMEGASGRRLAARHVLTW
jgi:hypothetical protein